MTDDDAVLAAFRLADSFLPTGSHTASYGLEQFVQSGRVADVDDLEALVETYLRRQVGPGDLVAVQAAHAAARDGDIGRACEADRRLVAATLSAEFRESARRTGDRLLSLQRELREDDLLARYAARVDAGDAPGTQPAVLGVTTGRAGVGVREACLVCCHGFVTDLLGAGQRLLSLGHTDAQRVLDRLRPSMSAAVDDAAARDLDAMTPFAPTADVLSAEHERADRRLFTS
ncbi:MAG: urease accessory protein UreF [Halobellus sp.]|uniref:urease accessory protein UreF n=1 Tax=Halobellus sp. TaxID=1979212 RepID=UPI0035D437BA